MGLGLETLGPLVRVRLTGLAEGTGPAGVETGLVIVLLPVTAAPVARLIVVLLLIAALIEAPLISAGLVIAGLVIAWLVIAWLAIAWPAVAARPVILAGSLLAAETRLVANARPGRTASVEADGLRRPSRTRGRPR